MKKSLFPTFSIIIIVILKSLEKKWIENNFVLDNKLLKNL